MIQVIILTLTLIAILGAAMSSARYSRTEESDEAPMKG